MVGLFITRCSELILRLETFSLIDRVVQLGIRVAHLPAVDVELKTLDKIRTVRLALGQR